MLFTSLVIEQGLYAHVTVSDRKGVTATRLACVSDLLTRTLSSRFLPRAPPVVVQGLDSQSPRPISTFLNVFSSGFSGILTAASGVQPRAA